MKKRMLIPLFAAILLPGCGITVEAGLKGQDKNGNDWFVGVKSPPIPWPAVKEPEPPLPQADGKTPVLVAP